MVATPGRIARGPCQGDNPHTTLGIFERRLLEGFLVSILIASLPSDVLFYAAPLVFLASAVAIGDVVSVRRILLLAGGIVTFSALAMIPDHLSGRNVNVAGLSFSLAMYAPIVVLLAIDPRLWVSSTFARRLARLLALFVLVQTPIAVTQFIVAGRRGLFPGDFVSGTYGLLDILRGPTINQVTFTFTMFSAAVFLYAYRDMLISRIAMACALGVSVLAQSAHQLLFFVLALIASAMMRTASLATMVRGAVLAVVAFCAISLAYPETLHVAREWQHKLFDPSTSPKMRIVHTAAAEMWSPRFLVIGTGAGQFTSRAALFSSGDYLSVQLPSALTGRSDWFVEHLSPELGWYKIVGEASAIAKPYFSVLTVAMEGGALFAVIVALGLASFVTRQAALSRRSDDEIGDLAFFCVFLTLFWLLCSLIENYAELVQGIWLPALMMIAALARQREAQSRRFATVSADG